MRTFFDTIQQLGASSAEVIWFPVLIWSCIASLIFFVLRIRKSINPLYQYHIRVATLLALPIGIASAIVLQFYTFFSASAEFNTPVFVVENPLPAIYKTVDAATTESTIPWFEVNFLIGLISSVIVLGASILLIKLVVNYVQLRRLHSQLPNEPLTNTEFTSRLKDGSVSVAFHSHPLVPFTFGWKNPIIVLPEKIREDKEKLNMAIQHELVHIRRGDYLLQLALSVIESLFWFHPLIKIGYRDIETFREISCDQEVLNTSDIHPKKYANLLLELIPLNKEYGNFTVSMAVKQSTLKQRIETMKHHKMHQTSYKRSLLLLLTITLIVIAPIACSDLQTSNSLTTEELGTMKLKMDNPKITINGKEVFNEANFGNQREINALSGISIGAGEYGVFVFSTQRFDGATLSGTVKNKKIDFTVNQLNVQLENASQNFLEERGDIWVKHFSNRKAVSFIYRTFSYSDLQDGSYESKLIPEQSINNREFSNEELFVVVENMPELQGGQVGLQSKVLYPPVAIRAGIEGRVTVQFIVDKNGDVVNPKVIRGIGGGCDEEALRVISQAKFTPGKQRGRNVAVQMSLPILFKLSNSEFKQSSDNSNELPPPPPRPMKIETLESSNGAVKVKISNGYEPLVGATVKIKDSSIGTATNNEGIATFTGLDIGTYTFVVSFVGYGQPEIEITVI
ncbi:MAG: TonB family protein [Balneola sp.]